MKFKIAVLSLILLSTINFPQVNSLEKINSIIDDVSLKFAPDKRVALINVQVSKNGEGFILQGETNMPDAKEELMEKIRLEKIKVVDEIQILPEKKLKDKIYGIVNLSVANLRSNPKHPAELSTQALLGTIVRIYKSRGGFYLIQTPDDYLAWVDDDGIFPVNIEQLNDWNSMSKIIFWKDFGFAYSERDENSQRVSDLVIGDILIKLGETEEFVKVQFPDKRIAFIKKDEIFEYDKWLNNSKPTQKNIVETAHKFMGIPYLWGGTSAKGMDCSGFTKTVYFLNGVVLDRDASQQVHKGILVDTQNGFDNLKKGDLLFFGFKGTEKKKERITHVGIYIGNLEFIHEAGRVKINSFDESKPNFSKFRLDHFIRARRIIGSLNENGITTVKRSKFYNGDF